MSDFDTSSGTVTNLAGTTLALGNFQGTLAGDFYAADGSVIQFLGGASTNYLAAGGSLVLAGGGQYQFKSGYLEFTDNVIPDLALAGGTLGFGPNFQGGAITNLTLNSITLSNTLPVTGIFNATNGTIYGNFTVESGGVLNGYDFNLAGSVTVAAGGLLLANGDHGIQVNSGGSLTVDEGGELDLIKILSLFGTLTNSGTINMTNDGIEIYNDGSENSWFGGLVNETGGQINIYGNSFIVGYTAYYIQYTYDYFINDGALTLYTGNATVSVEDFDPGSGTVTNLGGTLALGNFQGTLAGNFYATNGSVIQFNGGASTSFLTPGTPLGLAGGGQYQFTSGYLELATNIIPGVALMGGTLELGTDFQGGAITNLTVSGTTLTNTLPVTGIFNATNCVLYGDFNVASGDTVNMPHSTFYVNPFTIASGVVFNAYGGIFNEALTVAANGLFNGGNGTISASGSLTVAEGGELDLINGGLTLNGP